MATYSINDMILKHLDAVNNIKLHHSALLWDSSHELFPLMKHEVYFETAFYLILRKYQSIQLLAGVRSTHNMMDVDKRGVSEH